MIGIIPIAQLGQIVGALAVQTLEYARQGADRPRAAHITRPRIDDFVTPLELLWSRASALVAVLAAGFVAVSSRGVAKSLVLLVELSARALVAARPAASDVQSLAFDDALRPGILRALLSSTGLLPLAIAVTLMNELIRPSGPYYALVLVYLARLRPADLGRVLPAGQAALQDPPVARPGTVSR